MGDKTILLGIDVGATSIKVGAFDETGRLMAIATTPTGPVPDERFPGGHAWDFDAIWTGVTRCSREVVNKLGAAVPQAIGVTTFGVDGGPFGPDGDLKRPFTSWHDARAAQQARALEDALGVEEHYLQCGLQMAPMATASRWLWLTENDPGAFSECTWLSVADAVCYKLSGHMRTEHSIAATTAAYDMRARDWAGRVLEATGLDSATFAPWVQAGELVGEVIPDAAAQTGLPTGLSVVAAGHDAAVAVAATLGSAANSFVDIAGTWEILAVLSEEFAPTRALLRQGVEWAPYADGRSYVAYSSMPGGSVLNWVRQIAFPQSPWQEFVTEAASAGPGANGLTMVPAFVQNRGPYGLSGLTGSILGLLTTASRGDLARAAMESVSFQLRGQLELLEQLAGKMCDRLRVIGGGSRNDLWLQLRANILDRPVEQIEQQEVTLLGAAMFAGIGTGVYDTLATAQDRITLRVSTHTPVAQDVRKYKELKERFDRTIEAQRSAVGVGSCKPTE